MDERQRRLLMYHVEIANLLASYRIPCGNRRTVMMSAVTSFDNTILLRSSRNGLLVEIDDHPNPLQTENNKQIGTYISSSTLPLLLPDKIQRTKALVECEGESIDLSGDLGVVGRVVFSDSPSGNQDMFLDLKGCVWQRAVWSGKRQACDNRTHINTLHVKTSLVLKAYFFSCRVASKVGRVRIQDEQTLVNGIDDRDEMSPRKARLLVLWKSHSFDEGWLNGGCPYHVRLLLARGTRSVGGYLDVGAVDGSINIVGSDVLGDNIF
ncbi:DNA-binding protein BIN4 [Tanacetum coccineum]